jgi:hypothetical protein
MFIIERRTVGVLAALAITAAMVILGNVWDRVDVVETPTGASPTSGLATSVRPGVTPTTVAANAAQAPRGEPAVAQSR